MSWGVGNYGLGRGDMEGADMGMGYSGGRPDRLGLSGWAR